jgi:hypothetical protein
MTGVIRFDILAWYYSLYARIHSITIGAAETPKQAAISSAILLKI